MLIGYCLWCGAEVGVAGYDVRSQQIEWEKCRALHPCLGGIYTVVTDAWGFVIHPNHRKGHYIFSRTQAYQEEDHAESV